MSTDEGSTHSPLSRGTVLFVAAAFLVAALILGTISHFNERNAQSTNASNTTNASESSSVRPSATAPEQDKGALSGQESGSAAILKEHWDTLPEPTVRLDGIVSTEIARNMNNPDEHLHIAGDEIAFSIASQYDALIPLEDDLNEYDFTITTDDAAQRRIAHATGAKQGREIGMSPIVFLTTDKVAEKLVEKGFASKFEDKKKTKEIYTLETGKFAKRLAEGMKWYELSAEFRSADPIQIVAPDPIISSTGRIAARSFIHAATDGQAFDSPEAASAAVSSPAYEALKFKTSRKESVTAEEEFGAIAFYESIVMMSEAGALSAVRNPKLKDANLTIIYPNSTMSTVLRLVPLSPDAAALISPNNEAVLPRQPFEFAALMSGYRTNLMEITEYQLHRRSFRHIQPNLPESPELKPEAVDAFEEALYQERGINFDRASIVPTKLDRPQYAK